MMAKGNTAAGTSDGAVKLWINGVLVMDYPAVDLRAFAECPDSNLQTFWISAYIGGPTDPHPAQEIWYDDIVVTTAPATAPGCRDSQGNPMIGPIGCSAAVDAVPPVQPRGLKVR
jgi:hypothetical protein